MASSDYDEWLYSFDRSRLDDYSGARAAQALSHVPDLYRNHLAIAKWLDGWIERNAATAAGRTRDEVSAAYEEGFEKALREVAAHLRQCDLLPPPDGELIEEEWRGRDRG